MLFTTIFSCSKDESPNVAYDCNDNFVDTIGLKVIHDELAAELCDSIISWRTQSLDSDTQVRLVFEDIMVNSFAQRANLNPTDVLNGYYDLGINVQTLPTWYQSSRQNFTPLQSDFMNDVENVYLTSSTESEIHTKLDAVRGQWKCRLDIEQVESTIEIAKSSFPYWKVNTDGCIAISGTASLRRDCGSAIAFADAWGTLTGAVTGGLPGAMLGALGGTLGSGIYHAISGGC